MENNYTVYVHINNINGKMYVGYTGMDVEVRWKNGNGYKGCKYFYRAIQKYGWDNFEHIIAASNLSYQEAINFEILLIKLLDTNNNNFGYNMTKGGDGTLGLKMSKDTKRKISYALSGDKHPLWGKHHSVESKNKMMGKRLSITGDKHPLYNVNRSDEVKLKISETKKKNGKTKSGNNPRARKIVCLNTDEVFNCIRDASKEYFISESNITKCLDRKQNYSGIHPITKEKMVWLYYEDYITKTEQQLNSILNFSAFKKIKCINTGEIFNSAFEASNKYNIEISSIRKCCNNKLKSAGKHPQDNLPMIWEYVA